MAPSRCGASLVVTQVGCAFLLLIGAGLLFASFRKVLEVDPGFTTKGVLTGAVSLPNARYADAEAVGPLHEGGRAPRARVAWSDEPPVRPTACRWGTVPALPLFLRRDIRQGRENHCWRPPRPESQMDTSRRLAQSSLRVASSPNAMPRAPRAPSSWTTAWLGASGQSRIRSAAACIVRATKPATHLRSLTKTEFLTVVGVVSEMKLRNLTDGDKLVGAYFIPLSQEPQSGLTFVLRTDGDPSTLAGALRREIAAIDPQLPVFEMQPMSYWTDRSLARRRSPALLSLAFGFVALFLSAIGIYGVLAYLVTQRRKEIGIRVALGSSAAGVFRLVLREGLVLVAAGLLVGGIGSFLLRRTLESQLFGVTATNPAVLIVVSAVLAAVAADRVRGAGPSRHQDRSADCIDGIANRLPVRVALGGTSSAIVAALLRQSLRPALIGVALGLMFSALVSRAAALVLFGVNPLDPFTYILTTIALCFAAGAASCIPALKATRADSVVSTSIGIGRIYRDREKLTRDRRR